MKETELAKYFIEYLSDFDLYFEVDYYRRVDIVAITDNYSAAIEVKTTFNFKVLEQAIDNKSNFNYSYIAVPKPKDLEFYKKLCSDYGVGLIILLSTKEVVESVSPKLNRYADNKKLKSRLNEKNKLSIAGAKNGETGVITAFGCTVENAVRYIRRHNGIKLSELVSGITHHYRTNQIARNCLANMIRAKVIKDLVIRDGLVYLSQNDPYLF